MTLLDQDRASLMALLDWYRAIGVDIALEDAPRDRFGLEEQAIAQPDPPRRLPERTSAPHARRTPEPAFATPAAEIAAHAVTQAAGADTLAALRAALEQFDGCALKGSATQLVLSSGPERAALMIVGDAPGSAEDASGQPFSGRSGPLLDAMLAAIGQDRTRAHLAHLVPWLPVGPTSIDFQPTDNPKAMAKLRNDPMILRNPRVDLAYGLVEAMDAAKQAAPHIRKPYLMMHGLADRIVPQEPVRSAIALMPRRADSHLAFYAKGYHLLLRDKEGPLVARDILAWIDDKEAALPSGADAAQSRPELAELWGSRRAD